MQRLGKKKKKKRTIGLELIKILILEKVAGQAVPRWLGVKNPEPRVPSQPIPCP